jgi:hypothetical protein
MKKIMLSLVVAVTAMAGMVNSAQSSNELRVAKVATCLDMSRDNIAAYVKRDYLQNRIMSWNSDKKLLGTDNPVVWIVPSSITNDKTVWNIPVHVRGNNKDVTYSVVLDCQNGKINYGQPL